MWKWLKKLLTTNEKDDGYELYCEDCSRKVFHYWTRDSDPRNRDGGYWECSLCCKRVADSKADFEGPKREELIEDEEPEEPTTPRSYYDDEEDHENYEIED
jgi:hypothetical protein